MACRVRCEAAPIVAGGTSCVEVTGTGITGNPLQVSEVVAPTVQHPLLSFVLPNGLSCGPNGFEVQPDRQIGGYSVGTPIGFLPTITTNQAGVGPGGGVPWGARFDYQIVCTEPNRPQIFLGYVTHPALHIVLEPGAAVTYAFEAYSTPAHNDPPSLLTPWFSIFIWHFENNGTGLIRYDTPFIYDGPGFGETFGPAEPVGTFAWKGYQSYIATSGFTGASAVSGGFFGSGPSVTGVGLAA